MLFKIIKALTFILYLIICIGCNKGWQYIEKSSDYVSFGIDYHDIEKIVDSNAQSLLSSDYVNKLKENKILVISDIINQTQDDIDIEVLSRKLMRKIAQSHKFTLSNVVGGEDIRIDTMIYDSRNFNKNEYFNQYTTQEKGTLVAPELSLSGKFISRLKYIGNIIRMDYIFLLTLTDLKTGKVVWDNEEIISKAIDKQHAKDFLESKKTRNVTFNTKDDSNTADNTYSQQESIENTETIEEQLKKIKQLCPKVYIYDEYNKNNQTCDDLVENFIQNAIKHSMQEYIATILKQDQNDEYREQMAYSLQILMYEQLCDEHVGIACYRLGLAAMEISSENIPEAIPYLQKACENGAYQTCFLLGLTLIKDDMRALTEHEEQGMDFNTYVFKKDKIYYANAFAHFKKACEVNVADSCHILSELYIMGLGVSKDINQSRKYIIKACEVEKIGESCYSVGLRYLKGYKGFMIDNTQSLLYFKKACEKRYSGGCTKVAFMYKNGIGVKQNMQQALRYYKKGCDIEMYPNDVCADIGLLYYHGEGVEQSYHDAFTYFQRACEHSSASGCYNLGVLYHNGDGVRQNYTQAKESYGKACDLGFQSGCEMYREFNMIE